MEGRVMRRRKQTGEAMKCGFTERVDMLSGSSTEIKDSQMKHEPRGVQLEYTVARPNLESHVQQTG